MSICRECGEPGDAGLAVYFTCRTCRRCPHVRQDVQCSCSAGDEQPNGEHHEMCGRRNVRCGYECSLQGGRC